MSERETGFFLYLQKLITMQIQRIFPVIGLLLAVACGQPKQSENTFGGNESVQSVFGNAPIAQNQLQQMPQQQQGFGNNPNMGGMQQMPQQQQGFGNNPNMGGMQQNPQQMQQQGMMRPMLEQMQNQVRSRGGQFQAWTFAGPMCVGLITVTRSQQGMECALEYTDVNYDYEYPITFLGQNQGWYYFQIPNTQYQVFMDANGTQLYIGNSIVMQACTPEQCDQVLIQVATQRSMMQGGYGNYGGGYDNYQGYSY